MDCSGPPPPPPQKCMILKGGGGTGHTDTEERMWDPSREAGATSLEGCRDTAGRQGPRAGGHQRLDEAGHDSPPEPSADASTPAPRY